MILPEHKAMMLAGLPVRNDEAIWKLADNRYGCDRTRSAGEKWQLARTPWVKQILDDYQNPDVRQIVLMAGSQCAKTAPALICLAWAAAFKPSPKLWLTGNDDKAKDASQERITPTLERCPDAAKYLLPSRQDRTIWKVRLANCTIDIAGAQSAMALEQNPYEDVFGDEVRQWPQGHLQKVEKRQRSYDRAKRMLFSTPDMVGDEFHQQYLAGTQCEWVWPCMGCGTELTLQWKDLIYDKPGGQNNDVGAAPAHAERVCCGNCGRLHTDCSEARRHIVDSGRWKAQNPSPAPGCVSYHWNALLPPWVRWADLVSEFKAAHKLLEFGNIEPLKVFICETLGEPFADRSNEEALKVIPSPYEITDKWVDEYMRVITGDVQQFHIWFVCRLWSKDGRSRLLQAGRVGGFDELRQKQIELAVPDNRVLLDSGYNAPEVYQRCKTHGWHAMKGEDVASFVTDQGGKRVPSMWRLGKVDPYIGRSLQGQRQFVLVLWSVSSAMDMLAHMMSGKGPEWLVPREVPEDYQLHLRAASRQQVKQKNGTMRWEWRYSKADHLLDCEKMQIIKAVMSGLLTSQTAAVPATEAAPA